MKKICNMDCFHCTYNDCINDNVYSEKSRYCNRSEWGKQRQRDYQKKKRDEAREKGLCIICKQKKATHGEKCYECYLRQKRHDKKKNKHLREYWLENGLCYYCGAKTIQGKKVCEKHYQIVLKNLQHCIESENTKQARKNFGKLNNLIFGSREKNM